MRSRRLEFEMVIAFALALGACRAESDRANRAKPSPAVPDAVLDPASSTPVLPAAPMVAPPAPTEPAPGDPAPAMPPVDPGPGSFAGGQDPEPITGINLVELDFDNARLRCDHVPLGGPRYEIDCRAVAIRADGRELLGTSIATGITITWGETSATATLVAKSCEVAASGLSQKCVVELAQSLRGVDLKLSFRVAAPAANKARLESATVRLPYSVGVAAGLVPSLPFLYRKGRSALALADAPVAVEQGYQRQTFPFASMPFADITGLAVCGDVTYIADSGFIYAVTADRATLFAGSRRAAADEDLSHANRLVLPSMRSLACSESGLVVVTGNRLLEISTTTQVATLLGTFSQPSVVASGIDGTLYVGELTGTIYERSRDGALRSLTGATSYFGIKGLARAKDGVIYFTAHATVNNVIDTSLRKMTPDGTVSVVVEGFPGYLAVDPSGNVFNVHDKQKDVVSDVTLPIEGFDFTRGMRFVEPPVAFAFTKGGTPRFASREKIHEIQSGKVELIAGPALWSCNDDDVDAASERILVTQALGYMTNGELAFSDRVNPNSMGYDRLRILRRKDQSVRMQAPTPCTDSVRVGASSRISDFPGGATLLASWLNIYVDKSDGTYERRAGIGMPANGGDGGPAVNAMFGGIRALIGAADGSIAIVVRVDEGTPAALRRIDPAGIVTTIATLGTGDVALGRDAAGRILVSDETMHRIDRIGDDGVLTRVAGTGAVGFSGDGGPASAATVDRPTRALAGPDGAIYFGDRGTGRIRRIAPDGSIATIAGSATELLDLDIGGIARSGEIFATLGRGDGARLVQLERNGNAWTRTHLIGGATQAEDCGVGTIAGTAGEAEVGREVQESLGLICQGSIAQFAMRDTCDQPNGKLRIAVAQAFRTAPYIDPISNVVEVEKPCPAVP